MADKWLVDCAVRSAAGYPVGGTPECHICKYLITQCRNGNPLVAWDHFLVRDGDFGGTLVTSEWDVIGCIVKSVVYL